MSPTTMALICGVLFPIAAWLTWRAIHPAPLTLRAVQARVAPITPTPSAYPTAATRIGRYLSAGPLGRMVDGTLEFYRNVLAEVPS